MELDKRKSKNKNKVETIDLMDGLMQIEDDYGNLNDNEIVDTIISLVIGGYVTTSLVSIWAIYLLAKYPNVLKKLRVLNIPLLWNNQKTQRHLFIHIYFDPCIKYDVNNQDVSIFETYKFLSPNISKHILLQRRQTSRTENK